LVVPEAKPEFEHESSPAPHEPRMIVASVVLVVKTVPVLANAPVVRSNHESRKRT
jgi:hypothetical protein